MAYALLVFLFSIIDAKPPGRIGRLGDFKARPRGLFFYPLIH